MAFIQHSTNVMQISISKTLQKTRAEVLLLNITIRSAMKVTEVFV